MSANSKKSKKSKTRKRNSDNSIENDDNTELTTVPDKGEICKDNESTPHVGDDESRKRC